MNNYREINIISDLDLINYNAYHITKGNRKGGDVAIYTRNCRLLEAKSIRIECITVEQAVKNHTNIINSCM